MRSFLIITTIFALAGSVASAAAQDNLGQARYNWAMANCHARKFTQGDTAETSWFKTVTLQKWQAYQKSCLEENKKIAAPSKGTPQVLAQAAPPSATADAPALTAQDYSIISRLADMHFGKPRDTYLGSGVTPKIGMPPPLHQYCRSISPPVNDAEARGTVQRWWCPR